MKALEDKLRDLERALLAQNKLLSEIWEVLGKILKAILEEKKK